MEIEGFERENDLKEIKEVNLRVKFNIYAMKQLDPDSDRYRDLYMETDGFLKAVNL